MDVQNQDGVTTEISISSSGEISVDVVDLHNGAFALINRFYALESVKNGVEGDLEALGIYFTSKAAYEALEALKRGSQKVSGKSMTAIEYIEATSEVEALLDVIGDDWQELYEGDTALEYLDFEFHISRIVDESSSVVPALHEVVAEVPAE